VIPVVPGQYRNKRMTRSLRGLRELSTADGPPCLVDVLLPTVPAGDAARELAESGLMPISILFLAMTASVRVASGQVPRFVGKAGRPVRAGSC